MYIFYRVIQWLEKFILKINKQGVQGSISIPPHIVYYLLPNELNSHNNTFYFLFKTYYDFSSPLLSPLCHLSLPFPLSPLTIYILSSLISLVSRSPLYSLTLSLSINNIIVFINIYRIMLTIAALKALVKVLKQEIIYKFYVYKVSF